MAISRDVYSSIVKVAEDSSFACSCRCDSERAQEMHKSNNQKCINHTAVSLYLLNVWTI